MAIDEKVQKLENFDFLIEVKYPSWLANMVLERKVSNKLHMCIDFIDLCVACPNNLYPLSNINRLIDRSSGYKILSFMDAYY